MSNAARSDTYGLSSVDNALRLLQLIQARRVLRVSEAATELGVARSTAHRLLAALRERGFVAQDKPNGVYRPGWSLNEIGLTAIGQLDIRRVARPVLEDLREKTQETASLLVLESVNVRFIDCVEGQRSLRVGSRVGLVLPAHCTAAGKSILAALPPSELARRYVDRDLESRTPVSITEWQRLDAELTHVRQCGYAVNLEESEQGVSAIGVAIQDPIGSPIAALAVAIPSSRMGSAARREVAPALAAARRTITDLLFD